VLFRSLKRGTQRIITLGVMIAALIGAGWLATDFVRNFFQRSSVLSVAATTIVVVIVLRGARWMEKVVERTIYPERLRLRQMINDFLQRTAALGDKKIFWEQLEARLRDGLVVDGVYPVLRTPQDGYFLLRDVTPTPFRGDSNLVALLSSEQRPIMVDEALSGTRVKFLPSEAQWLTGNRVALVLPLVTHGSLVGFLCFGAKTEREDYAAEELRILGSLAPQVALASDNMRLLEENIEKRRMEEELQVARKVQEGFLPKNLPPTPGLELAAQSTFSLEVAGDYYDVIAMSDGRTVLAVGDVSGKGTGAALLMANLQASLRALTGMNLTLAEMVGRINLLIHRNTVPDQFITFFVCLFDPATRSLTYVNAGHNHPLLVHTDGQVDPLDTGGLILGPFCENTYEQETLTLAVGDVLLFYTDGVSEAMNAREEELGEARLRDAVLDHSARSSREIMDSVKRLLSSHQVASQPLDDQTLLVAKVL
jgi:serine phosphatase RsbU (regulator of sigma subunit)